MDLDLDDLGGDVLHSGPTRTSQVSTGTLSTQDALSFVNEWYTEKSRKGRRMDLIGDYAGTEPFVLDGESLLQNVLDDPLLAIGRTEEPSYQLLHAKHSLEYYLGQFSSRSAVFDIIFFGENRHLTLNTGSSSFVSSSRALARRHLFNHLRNINVPLYYFNSVHDPQWIKYAISRKPMFIMTNDGGFCGKGTLETQAILMQRIFLFDIMSQAIPVALFRGVEFYDSKILSFVFEQGLVKDSRKEFPDIFWTTGMKALDDLNREESRIFGGQICPLIPPSMKSSSYPDTFCDSLQQTMTTNFCPELLWAFQVHCRLLPHLSVQDRAQRHEPNHPELQNLLIQTFLPRVFIALEDFLARYDDDIDVDGNIFGALLRYLLLQCDVSPIEVFGPAVFTRSGGIMPSFSALLARFPPPSFRTANQSIHPQIRLLPFQHPVFDEQLSLVKVPLDRDDDVSFGELEFGKDTVFDDRHHWHNHNRLILPKHLGGEDPRPKDAWQRRKILKSNQRFMARLGHDAATLTGALGAKFDRVTITAVGHRQKDKIPAPPLQIKAPQQQSSKKGKKGPFVSSKEKLLQEIKKQKGSDESEGSHRWWESQLQDLSKMNVGARLAHLQRLERNARAEKGWLSIELRVYRLHHIISEWVARTTDQDTDAVRDEYTVSIMRIVKDLYESKDLTATAHEKLSMVITALGFGDYFSTVPPSAEDHELSFEFIKLIRSKSKKNIYKFMRISEHPTIWQLRLFGQFMNRSMGSKPDPRVSFEPDAWQRDVLDCLDKNESVLVVAPTSAGKTFISFYAMEKTLRESDDGVLVYVAPTKALVSQIAAEIYARFSKDVKNGTCWAIHTRDYRINDPQKCQILVTVPEMLSIMMLSPPLAKTWLHRVKRIILDEIHTIGQQEGGAVWEQILLLAPCPIIGLSATIGEPETFNAWLTTVQAAHGYKHNFIHHPHRYSHLRKFYYLLQDEKTDPDNFAGLTKHRSTQRMKFIHPIAMLSFGARSMPPDLSLEASDTLSLYGALKSHPGAVPSADLERLEPARFFASGRLLRQEDILLYESALKEVVSRLMSSIDQNGPTSHLKLVTEELTDPSIRKLTDIELNALPDNRRFRSQLINLVSDLHIQGDLPALLFNFDRTSCEIMAYDLVEKLTQAEENWRSTSAEWKNKIRAYQSWLEKAKQRERQSERVAKQKKGEDAPLHEVPDASWESTFDPNEPSDQFSFTGTTSYSRADLQKQIEGLTRWTSTDARALEALKRGIGIHHAGMNKRYRSLVESLFRRGFLRVVIATGTLALGINAPTRTSVFCGDSPYLSALMYRQCAGRAGRRGHDLLGKVVFYGLAFDRVQRLALSKLPSLGGNFPLTSTLVLRLFNLVEGSNLAPVAVNAVKSLLTLPQIVCTSKEGAQQLVHHVRFSIEYLRRARLLDYQGKPMNLFGIAAHLYYTEPSNFALVALLRAGVLHKICANPSTIVAKQDFIMLMAHLFGRRYLPRAFMADKETVRKSPSIVVLPRLDKRAREVLVAHEHDILRIFASYALTYATQNSAQLGKDTELPLSKIRYDGLPSDDSLFRRHLEKTAIPVVARSSFVANSGHGDQFESISELARTTRSGLYLNEHAIPSVGRITAIPDEKDDVFELNAYIYDFYMHGQSAALAKANGIRRGDVWYLLQDFELSLMTIRGVIEQLLLQASREPEVQSSVDETEGFDSGYGNSDIAEEDGDDDDDDSRPGITRPPRVNDEDWKVYEVVNEALVEFSTKFRAIWA